MYAGSTLINLTLIWGFQIIFRKDLLRGKGSLPEDSEHQQDQHLSSTESCWSLIKHKLSFLNDTGVNIQKETTKVAKIMLLSMIPFLTVELVALVNSPIMILFALVVSGASLILYIVYQIGDPWIANTSLAYLKQEELEERLRFHAKRLINEDIIKEDGSPNFKELKSIFKKVDENDDNFISQTELEDLIGNVFELQKDDIPMEYAKATIMSHFDDDNSGNISLEEFEKGCKKWMEKWKIVPNSSNSASGNLWEKTMKMVITKMKGELAQMDKIMPKMLKQLDREEHGLVTPDRKADKQKIERLFSKYDEDGDGKLKRDELKKFIKEFRFGISLDPNTVMDKLIADFSTDGTIAIHEFVEGFARWTEKFIDHDPNIKDPFHKLKTEKDIWAELGESPQNTLTPQAAILYVAFGIGVMSLISRAFTQSVLQFSNAAHIPLHLTSFVVFPFATYARMVIKALLNIGSHVEKNASLTFFEIYGELVMNNLFGLFTLLIIVCVKRLSWTYSNEVLIIMIPCTIVGLFALKRDTYPLWASILAVLLYPIICLYYVMYS
ncbi:putative EF-hand domain-containing protein [Helianthus debilis subsp. tardiflorus]